MDESAAMSFVDSTGPSSSDQTSSGSLHLAESVHPAADNGNTKYYWDIEQPAYGTSASERVPSDVKSPNPVAPASPRQQPPDGFFIVQLIGDGVDYTHAFSPEETVEVVLETLCRALKLQVGKSAI